MTAPVHTGTPAGAMTRAEPRQLPTIGVEPGAKVSVTQLIALALEKGTPIGDLKDLVTLHERIADREAAQEFAAALAAFQQECPPIKHSREANIKTKGGGSYKFTYAELDHIARTVAPLLAKHGLSYTWDGAADKGVLSCTCTLRHVNGHSVQSRFSLTVENNSGMSEQQKYGAAYTFAQRRSLSAVLGLTTTDEDNEAAPSADPDPITEDQATLLADKITETKANLTKFLAYFDLGSIEQLPAVRYDEAMNALNQLAARRNKEAK